MKKLIVFIIIVLFCMPIAGYAQNGINYEETKVPDYHLPELLVTQDGETVTNVEAWTKIRRPEILSLFEEQVYGKVPGSLKLSSWKLLDEDGKSLNGKAIRKQVQLIFHGNGKELAVNLLIFLPQNIERAPVFLGYNFYGNHTVTSDPEIIIPTAWSRNNEKFGVFDHQPTEGSRGKATSRWPLEKIIDGGYGVATMYYGEIDPDKYGAVGIDYSDGVHPLLFEEGQTKPLANEWGGISAWAWGLSRALDYLEEDNDIDHQRVAVFGHSRLGKAALWAGAQDKRFALVISNNSGSGGAALSRREFGERLEHMGFTHWFAKNFSKYHKNEDALPVDQHMLIALIAPRPVYIASAEEDLWADPKGEYLSGYYAGPVFSLFGKKALSTEKMPEVDCPVMTTVGYHVRKGGHDITEYDWEQFMKFFNLHSKKEGRSAFTACNRI